MFLFPHLVVYDTKASLPPETTEPAAKWAKMCADVNGYSMSTNISGFQEGIFKYSVGNTDYYIKKLVEGFVMKLALISQKSFNILTKKYSDFINALDQAVADREEYI